MSNTASIISVATAWAGTAGGGLAVAKKYLAKAEKYIANAEKQAEQIISSLEALDAQLQALMPAVAPAKPKPKSTSKKITEAPTPKKRLR
jgi:hypothetical protein